MTTDGDKPIEQFKLDDLILMAPEDEPAARLEVKLVGEVFTSFSPILWLRVGDKEIRTTEAHPFYVQNKGWIEAAELREGELICSHDGNWLAVRHVSLPGEPTRVYNLRIADYYTYFVGSRAWDFSVWAHNACWSAGKPGNPGNGPQNALIHWTEHGHDFPNLQNATQYA